ncbi:hypothetical protein CRYUN_Cryun31cG0019700 [Craigia yunnanensis]
MAQAMASIAGLRGSSQAVLEGSLQLSGQIRLSIASKNRVTVARPGFTVRAQQAPTEPETGRRAVLGLVAAAGTLNSDEPRDLDLPLKSRFFLQPLTPAQAAQRAKESAKDILGVKSLIDKKAWPYVQNDLRYDLNTVISAKPKDEKNSLKELTKKFLDTIDDVPRPQ